MKNYLGIEGEMEFREDVPRGIEVRAIMYDESSHISREAMDILIGRTKEMPLFRWPDETDAQYRERLERRFKRGP